MSVSVNKMQQILISVYPPMMRTFLPRRSMSIPCETHSMSQDQTDPPGKHILWSSLAFSKDILSFVLSNPTIFLFLLSLLCPISSSVFHNSSTLVDNEIIFASVLLDFRSDLTFQTSVKCLNFYYKGLDLCNKTTVVVRFSLFIFFPNMNEP